MGPVAAETLMKTVHFDKRTHSLTLKYVQYYYIFIHDTTVSILLIFCCTFDFY